MRIFPGLILFFLLSSHLHCQIITGRVIDSSNGNPIEYVSIGIVETPLGTISNENGEFTLEVKGQSNKAIVRVSMIGFISQTFSLEDLCKKKNEIRLANMPIKLAEVIVKPFSGKLKKVGTTDFTKPGQVCGWSGTEFGKGSEEGLKIALGNQNVKLQSLHIHVWMQSFDSCLFRLHIRNVINDLPANELLNDNILLIITKKSGWVNVDLKKYNLVFKEDIALTIEWIKVIGVHQDRVVKFSDAKQSIANNILFNVKEKQGCFYRKNANEDKWSCLRTESPCFYLTIQEH
ncbi:MAG: carboxypeptidase-like regulatory domain-containing protein [Bacteroidetes bacterium]|nr:carboxypeptidase-like regulatory domain-containing protein [Bacteroidota bacterium]